MTALVSTFTNALQITEPRLNCGSESEPETGIFRSISPREFLSTLTAKRTGKFLALEFSKQIAEGKLVDEKVIVRSQRSVVQEVMNIHVERAFYDRVTRVFGRVIRELGELDPLRTGLEINVRPRG